MADESRRSTAAQFFMDEEDKHNESISTYDKVELVCTTVTWSLAALIPI